MTELSATAPLKVLARSLGFRGATLPGFSREMMQSLLLDYEAIDVRVRAVKSLLDRAVGATIRLSARGEAHELYLDLRHRTGHASGGLMREPSVVGNLPSGEAYIVPYEGERAGEPSTSEGTLPVQFNDEIVVFDIRENRATAARGSGPASQAEHRKLLDEPAYGNIAELGIGILGELGVQAIGRTLLDEKLGLHIAFGQSDHFGGVTGPASFRNQRNIVHIDWVYVPSVQRDIKVESVRLTFEDGSTHDLFRGQQLVA
jgi:leucyl aminopeptidase (aminopeptidase T)